jgi:hypothetical protein
MTYLDSLPFAHYDLNGARHPDTRGVGLHGRLGHLPGLVSGGGIWSPHAISAAAPYALAFDLSNISRRATFRARVTLDATSAPRAEATLLIYADHILIGALPRVKAGAKPRPAEAFVPAGTRELVLVSEHGATFAGSERAFTLWLDARLEDGWPCEWRTYLGDIDVQVPEDWDGPKQCETCLITATTPGYAHWTDNFLGSLYKNGDVRDASLVIFAGGWQSRAEEERLRDLGKKYNALLVPFKLGHRENITSKLGATSVPHLIDAQRYLALDGDMVVLRSLRSLLAAIDAMPDSSLGCCREWNLSSSDTLEKHVTSGQYVYFGAKEDADRMGMTREERDCRLIANMGVYGGKKRAFLGLESLMRSMLPEAAEWESARMPAVTWREQAIMNRAGALLGLSEFDSSFNVQLLTANVAAKTLGGEETLYCEGRPVNVLHFNGNPGKQRYPEYQDRYLEVARAPHFAPLTNYAANIGDK